MDLDLLTLAITALPHSRSAMDDERSTDRERGSARMLVLRERRPALC
jgi:hypothetical protein